MDFEAELVTHRAALLRHCYRMMGSYAEAEDRVQETMERAWRARATYSGAAPVKRWLYTIATNACLNAIAKQKRSLPQLERDPATLDERLERTEHERWITPAPDARLFPDAAIESRETVALAFIALLQRVPARQRAALLMKDVLGWPAEAIAEALGLTTSSVNSALHRARRAVAREDAPDDPPDRDTVRAFVRAWEHRDLEALVALLREDVTLAMPPYAAWFSGIASVARFLGTASFDRFWTGVRRVALTGANGRTTLGFFSGDREAPYALMVTRFLGGRVAEMTVFVDGAHPGFDFSSP